LELDIRTEKGQILHLDLEEMKTKHWPVIMGQRGLYLVSTEDGRLALGSTHEKQLDYNLQPTVKGMHALLTRALPVAPRLEETNIHEMRVGLRPYTSNSLPVIASLDAHPNVFIANGLGASGLTIGPYLGRELAELALDQPLEIPLGDYVPTYHN
ncbi:MAG: FAD-binding oxidoreductase, partial [Exiguobacterium oxidotolerans]